MFSSCTSYHVHIHFQFSHVSRTWSVVSYWQLYVKLFEILPACWPKWLSHFTTPSALYDETNVSASLSTLFTWSFFILAVLVGVGQHLWFQFAFPWLLMILSIFSCDFLAIYICLENVCPDPLPVFFLVGLFVCYCWVVSIILYSPFGLIFAHKIVGFLLVACNHLWEDYIHISKPQLLLLQRKFSVSCRKDGYPFFLS